MIVTLWNTYLYIPLFNVLMLLYNTFGAQNLGLAVVWLTICIRIILSPLTLIEERNIGKYRSVGEKLKELERDVPSDQILRRNIMREYLKKQRVNPWAKIISLGLQLLVLVLLYQVFVAGFRSPKSIPLYAWVQEPGAIHTSFFGLFDVAKRNFPFSGFVAVVLFFSIWREQHATRLPLERSQLIFRLLFPIFTFIALAILPSVKSVFILTSMVYTFCFHAIKVFFDRMEGKKHAKAGHGAQKPIVVLEGNPWEALKK